MKILAALFRFLCALIVLLAIAVYLGGSLQVTPVDYLAAFTPERLMAFADLESWVAIAAGALLLLTLCCGIKLGWNLVYSLATLVFFAEVTLLVGPELALPTATRGQGWESTLRELAPNYPVPVLMVPALCILGCLCSSAPVRIAWTSLLCFALCYGCAELLHYGVQHWQAMPEPFMPGALAVVEQFPWALAALPAVFFVQYCLFMAMFETFIPRKKKVKAVEEKEEKKDTPAEEKKEDKPAAPAALATPVVVKKRPVIHKKSPISPAPAAAEKTAEVKEADAPTEEKKDEAPKADAPAEEKKDEAPEADAPAEEKKDKAPEADAPAEEKKDKASEADAPAEEKKDEAPEADAPAEEKKDEAPEASAIPSVPLPPETK